jgi:hypothetical protein
LAPTLSVGITDPNSAATRFHRYFFIADQATFLGQQPYSNRIRDDLRRNFSAAIFL